MRNRMRLLIGLCPAALGLITAGPTAGEDLPNAHFTGQEVQRAFGIMDERCAENNAGHSSGCRVLRHVKDYVYHGVRIITGDDPVDVYTDEYLRNHADPSDYIILSNSEKKRAAAALFHVSLLHVLERMDEDRGQQRDAIAELEREVRDLRTRSYAPPDVDLLFADSDDAYGQSMLRFGSSFAVAHLTDAFAVGGEASAGLTKGPIWYEVGVSLHQSQISHIRAEAGPWWRVAGRGMVAVHGGIGAYYDGRDTPQKLRIGPVAGAGAGISAGRDIELWANVRMFENRRRTDEFAPDLTGYVGVYWRMPNTLD